LKTILFIAYEFPPLNFGGVHRSLAFVKYFKQLNIKPVVITLSPASYSNVYTTTKDTTLGKNVLSDNVIIEIDSDDIKSSSKSGIKNFFATFFNIIGNESKGWRKDFRKKIDEIIIQYKPEAVYVSVPPFSILKDAHWVSKKFQLPLIVDFRDAWSQWRIAPYGSYLHYLATLLLERKYIKHSDAIIATSNQTLNDFKKLHPDVNKKKFHLISNGYDDEINNWNIDLTQKENYTIGYVGSFYYVPEAASLMFTPWWKKSFHRKLQYIPKKQDWLYRSPYFFFSAIRKLFDEHKEYSKKLQIKFAGQKEDWLVQMIKDFKLQENVELIGNLSHIDSLQFQQSCDALLITSSKLIGGRDYSIAGKTFEYFKMHKPIISFVCDGAQKDILEESGLALICDPDNADESANNIKNLFEHKIHFTPNNDFLEGLSRKTLTKRLTEIIEEVILNNKN
jgi:glycosyltransferase involved in cell wall biosynthesis